MPTTTPTMPVTALKSASHLTHYLVAAYDSSEAFNQHILVVDPTLTEPTWVLRPRTTKLTRRNIMALAVPNLQALTLRLAQQLTHMVTNYITVREFPLANRRKGMVAAGPLVPTPWL